MNTKRIFALAFAMAMALPGSVVAGGNDPLVVTLSFTECGPKTANASLSRVGGSGSEIGAIYTSFAATAAGSATPFGFASVYTTWDDKRRTAGHTNWVGFEYVAQPAATWTATPFLLSSREIVGPTVSCVVAP